MKIYVVFRQVEKEHRNGTLVRQELPQLTAYQEIETAKVIAQEHHDRLTGRQEVACACCGHVREVAPPALSWKCQITQGVRKWTSYQRNRLGECYVIREFDLAPEDFGN
jgi:hypothetical protein